MLVRECPRVSKNPTVDRDCECTKNPNAGINPIALGRMVSGNDSGQKDARPAQREVANCETTLVASIHGNRAGEDRDAKETTLPKTSKLRQQPRMMLKRWPWPHQSTRQTRTCTIHHIGKKLAAKFVGIHPDQWRPEPNRYGAGNSEQ